MQARRGQQHPEPPQVYCGSWARRNPTCALGEAHKRSAGRQRLLLDAAATLDQAKWHRFASTRRALWQASRSPRSHPLAASSQTVSAHALSQARWRHARALLHLCERRILADGGRVSAGGAIAPSGRPPFRAPHADDGGPARESYLQSSNRSRAGCPPTVHRCGLARRALQRLEARRTWLSPPGPTTMDCRRARCVAACPRIGAGRSWRRCRTRSNRAANPRTAHSVGKV